MTLQQLQQELIGKGAETLYILGNGFDIYHGLKSRYSDFRKWLLKNASPENGYREFVEGMERLFPLETNQDILWSNFEEALGKYDINLLGEEHREEHGWHSERKMVSDTHNICSQIRPNIAAWAVSIPLKNARKLLKLDEASWYLTFNYTRVLEEVYTIPDEHICHIHGDTRHKHDVITGHNWEFHHPDRDDESDIVRAEMHEEFNKLLKEPEKQMAKHSDFFKNMPKITQIVVIGHSLQDVDKEYFIKISKKVNSKSQWHFCKYQPKDRFAIYNLRFNLGTSVDLEQNSERYFSLPKSNGNNIWEKIL